MTSRSTQDDTVRGMREDQGQEPQAFGLMPAEGGRLGAAHPLMPSMFVWRFPAWIVRWLDGDTAECRIVRGLGDESVRKVRLLASRQGVQAYDLKDADPVRRAKAYIGLARCLEIAPAGAPVILAAEAKTGDIRPDSFGRILSQVVNAEGVNLGDALLAEELAVPYVRG